MSERGPDDQTLRSESPWGGFHDLMQYRVQDILLVSSLYDSFILAEDGQLNERILSESLELNLRHVPGVTRVSTGEEALELARKEPRFNLVITSMHVGDMDAIGLARRLKGEGLKAHVVLLAYDHRELTRFLERRDVSVLDGIFLWRGDVRIVLAIVKIIEDRMNLAHDTGVKGVQAIILVEDSVPFASSFLPVLYTEVINHSHNLVPEGVNLSHKLMRLQARPKILLCRTFEEAWELFQTYRENILGIISDIEFPRGGELAPRAGVELSRRVREEQPDIPIMLQSSRRENEALAEGGGCRLPAQGLARAPPAAPALHRRELRLRRLRLPAARRHRAGPRARPEDAGGDAPHGPRGLPRLSRRAKPLLDLAEGAHRVRSGPQPPAAHGRRLRRPGEPEAAAHPGDPGIPRRAGPAHRGRFRPRDVRRLAGSRASAAALSEARLAAWLSSTCSWTTTGSAAASGT